LPGRGAYCTSKSAITTYDESLYFDLKRYGLRIPIINQGFLKTSITNTNIYFMLMIKSVNYAANKIYNETATNNNFEIHFPKIFTITMKMICIMPYWIYFNIISIIIKIIKKKLT